MCHGGCRGTLLIESEHYFTEWEITVAPTCYNDGEQYRICTHCGIDETEVLTQLEHSFILNEETGLTTCEHCSAAEYNGNVYKIFTVELSWFDAYSYCDNLGGHLITITSAEEQAFLESYMSALNFSDRAWIGAYSGRNGYELITDEAFEYTNWSSGQPDCYEGVEFFAEINFGVLGKWNDTAPLLTRYLICEWEYQVSE